MYAENSSLAELFGSLESPAQSWEIPSGQLILPGDRRDHAASMRELLLAKHAARIQKSMGLLGPDEKRYTGPGNGRAIRDLDDTDPRTGEARLYRTASLAARALGKRLRAHHILRAVKRRGTAGGHRVVMDEDYRRRSKKPPPRLLETAAGG